MTEPVAARPAASLILVRAGKAGPEVLMGMRGAGHRFMPNRLVFPGGAVEVSDGAAPVAREPPEVTLAQLARGAGSELARGLAVAVARELEEETGLSLGVPPDLSTLRYLCRAVTPPSQPIRFDARFFVEDAGRVTGVLAGSGELEGLRWYPVEEALGLDLALVTREVLGRLVEWLAMPAGMRDGRAELPVFSARRWTFE